MEMMDRHYVGLFFLRSVDGFYKQLGVCDNGGSVCPTCGQGLYMKEILFLRKAEFRNVCFLCCDFRTLSSFNLRHVLWNK